MFSSRILELIDVDKVIPVDSTVLVNSPVRPRLGGRVVYSVDAGRCIKCGICWLYCPDDVISWAPKGLPIIDYSYCKGCGICSSVCPVKAIDMVLEGE